MHPANVVYWLPSSDHYRIEHIRPVNFLVAIVVVTIFFVPAFVLAVVFVPATAVPIVVMVPVMVVLETPARTSPVATVIAALFIAWNDPHRANIRRRVQ